MNRRILAAMAVFLAFASGCTSVDHGLTTTGYTRPDCAQDYLTGPKFPCYNQR